MTASVSNCIHELPLEQGVFCKAVPFGIHKIGFKTKHGRAFHNWDTCPLINDGQNFAVSRGGEASEIVNVTWSSGLQDLQPCEWCCALYYTKGVNLEECMVTINQVITRAKIVKSRYINSRVREYQIYVPESGEIWFFPGEQVTAI